MVSDIKRHITKVDTVLLHSNWNSLRRKHWSKLPTDVKVLICAPKASNISGISDAISPCYIRKNPRSMYAIVPLGMAQFVLKIEKLPHIIGTAPILETGRAYGLRPWLWLPAIFKKNVPAPQWSVIFLRPLNFLYIQYPQSLALPLRNFKNGCFAAQHILSWNSGGRLVARLVETLLATQQHRVVTVSGTITKSPSSSSPSFYSPQLQTSPSSLTLSSFELSTW